MCQFWWKLSHNPWTIWLLRWPSCPVRDVSVVMVIPISSICRDFSLEMFAVFKHHFRCSLRCCVMEITFSKSNELGFQNLKDVIVLVTYMDVHWELDLYKRKLFLTIEEDLWLFFSDHSLIFWLCVPNLSFCLEMEVLFIV